MEICLQPLYIGPLLHNFIKCLGTVSVADFWGCLFWNIVSASVTYVALASVPRGGCSPKKDLDPSTFFLLIVEDLVGLS